ncbi:putative phosphonate metabolism protein [Rhodopseudomonas rhenobacensis]|uniref:Putative phosphonate metabolism protein n=1 Tax=Rhodopseudomonas rhenobacensis TaxID=87461 RepID=A0A7W7Z4R9_9BRAD|nr:DUF1045 domain-containing protein [Rhodopseudomonas rhenobacensis]MBB5047996.1 putative phosphonate metabolism protein [Rhodopseudomonas rhenobacensis]
MSRFPRYAIYYVPAADSALARFGAALLGYDVHRGAELDFPADVAAAIEDWRELTADPRGYGFHATLKAPFSLAPAQSEAALLAACEDFAAAAPTVPVIEPTVAAISGFIAVVPATVSPQLMDLAQACVTGFDGFRAPLTEQDRARRNPARLTPAQLGYLDRWGYPYVFEQFRFHMTLTGRLPAERQPPVLALLQQRFAALALPELAIDRIALFRQSDAGERFRVIGEFELRPAAAGALPAAARL